MAPARRKSASKTTPARRPRAGRRTVEGTSERVAGTQAAERHASFWKRNGLSLALTALFLLTLVGQIFTGHAHENRDRTEHGDAPQTLAEYLSSGEFYSALFENWESEFLQMGMYVLMTVFLFQRGSAESRPLDPREEEEIEQTERKFYDGKVPAAANKPGLVGWLYKNSLSLALFSLFAISFVGHWIGSWRHHVDQSQPHGVAPHSVFQHLADSQFWFESFQNWQSEFLAVLAIVVLSIFLRQDKSTQSKPVDAPHSATGS